MFQLSYVSYRNFRNLTVIVNLSVLRVKHTVCITVSDESHEGDAASCLDDDDDGLLQCSCACVSIQKSTPNSD